MEIPGLAPLSSQPTLTNPLGQSEILQGQKKPGQAGSETVNTTTLSEQDTTKLSSIEVVNQVAEATEVAATVDSANIGGIIDITV